MEDRRLSVSVSGSGGGNLDGVIILSLYGREVGGRFFAGYTQMFVTRLEFRELFHGQQPEAVLRLRISELLTLTQARNLVYTYLVEPRDE